MENFRFGTSPEKTPLIETDFRSNFNMNQPSRPIPSQPPSSQYSPPVFAAPPPPSQPTRLPTYTNAISQQQRQFEPPRPPRGNMRFETSAI